jgi:uncharacterized protein YbjQ (UPF0145 family)
VTFVTATDLGALKTLIGGNIGVFETLCEQARKQAFDVMMQHADELGANAIIGMRYDANEVMGGITEVLAYGTAVGLEKITPEDTRGEIGAEEILRKPGR